MIAIGWQFYSSSGLISFPAVEDKSDSAYGFLIFVLSSLKEIFLKGWHSTIFLVRPMSPDFY